MARQLLYPQTAYAPFVGLILFPAGSTNNANGIKTGILEQGSKITFQPEFVGVAPDERYLGCSLNVMGLDPEASINTMSTFQQHNNQMMYGAFLCMGGGFIDGPFRYTVYPEYLEQRGMRFVHRLTGRTRWPGWTTFMDAGWPALLATCGESNSLYLGQVFQGKAPNFNGFWEGPNR